ncbi:MAG: neutral/alkaline non-lysosomal ceramidase N-terminal domain-containing protein [Pirellulaceae bacterium]|nr:neutral/alkaline non-lysosomal ceramidase N-terminal domain-containing protein [Pirellulaceae bacterium]
MNSQIFRTLAAGCLVWMTAASLPADEPKQLQAGAATSNITPLIGEPLVGGFSPEPSQSIHDELNARCLVLDDGQTRLGIVVCDNLSIAREICDEAKKLASAATGIPVDRILISATHTHSGPAARSKNLAQPTAELNQYQHFLVRRIADGLIRANKNLQPAKLAFGSVEVPEHLNNRRWRMEPGPDLENPFGGIDQVRMNPPAGSPKLIEPAGPIDPQVAFLSVRAKDGRPLALLANYSLHYVGGTRAHEVSADYFAMFADRVQELLKADRLDPPFVGMLSNGTSGDINNINFRQPRPRQPPYAQMRYVAHDVAGKVAAAHEALQFQDWVPLGMVQRELTLATRKPTPEIVEWAEKLVSGASPSVHRLDKFYAQRALDLKNGPDSVTIVLQALRIGELGIATTPFETFCETGLEIKRRSPFATTCTIELANGGYGYLPTPEQHRLGGYETWLGTSRVEIEASRKLTEQLVAMLEQLKAGK